jgi:hypothetical protein
VGDPGPNLGSKQDTISKLFNGNAAAWAAHDPLTVLARHGPYHDVTGLFISGTADRVRLRRNPLTANPLRARVNAGIRGGISTVPPLCSTSNRLFMSRGSMTC